MFKRRKKLRLKPLTRLIVYFIVFILFSAFCEKQVSRLPNDYILQNAKNYAQTSVSETISKEIENIQKNYIISNSQNKNLSYVEISTVEIGQIKLNLTNEINKNINGRKTCFVAIGTLLNYNLLNGVGFNIPVSMQFVGSATVELETTLISAGINQSVYKLTANVCGEISSLSLKASTSTNFNASYPLCELYISGAVPNYGLNALK